MIKISAVLIVQNEEALLPRCLESVKGLDEIIIVDGGSIDRTKQIASEYTDKIFDFPWCDNFAKSRNEAKSHATGDWILSIDADEILHDISKVREAVELAEQRNAIAVNIQLLAEDNGQKTIYPRLFKNVPEVWWEGAIHNHLSVLGEDLGNVKITYGYSPAHTTDPDRAYRILKKEVETRPDAYREMFYLGREQWYRKEYEDCLKTLGKYVQGSRFLSEKAEAFYIMARVYWEMKMGEDGRDACLQALKINPNFREAVLFMATLSGDGKGNEKWQKNADQWKKMAETADNTDVLFIRA